MLPLIPVTVPLSSTTTTCSASFFPLLSVTYTFETGLGAIDFQKVVAFVRPKVCWSYQSTAVEGVNLVAWSPVLLIPELLTKSTATEVPKALVVDPSWYVIAVSVDPPPTVSTLETTLTSTVLFPPVASVLRPTTIPFKKPVNPVVVPDPGMTALVSAAVTPKPIVAPAFARLVVAIPIVWSA